MPAAVKLRETTRDDLSGIGAHAPDSVDYAFHTIRPELRPTSAHGVAWNRPISVAVAGRCGFRRVLLVKGALRNKPATRSFIYAAASFRGRSKLCAHWGDTEGWPARSTV
jgi:hypothetical protein